MKTIPAGILLCVLFVTASSAGEPRIDRHALVTRHNIEWNDLRGQIPLGNGEFCFNADATGLQTFGGNTMSHWAWHSFPLPAGVAPDQIPSTGTYQKGPVKGPDVFPEGTSAIRSWMFDNPHIFNLGRIKLTKAGGAEIKPEEVKILERRMDIWSGIHTSLFTINNQTVRVTTCVHPDIDMVAFTIESDLLSKGELEISVDFPYPDLQRNRPWSGNFDRRDAHGTFILRSPADARQADIRRQIDSVNYYASIRCSHGGELVMPAADRPHSFIIHSEGSSSLELSCVFSGQPVTGRIDNTRVTLKKCTRHWQAFWKNGGAIDLSGSSDPRWKELERRIVLSQYLLVVQSAGSYPSSEAGLMEVDPWRGQFHMEMTWWHLAHYGLWNRWSMAEEALGCYRKFIPPAAALSQQLGYKGLKWAKSVGPEGRSAP